MAPPAIAIAESSRLAVRLDPRDRVANGGLGSRTVLATTSAESSVDPPIPDEIAAARKSAVRAQELPSRGQCCHRPIAVDEYLLWSISEGGRQFDTEMPAFKGTLSREEIWKVIAFMRAGFPAGAQ